MSTRAVYTFTDRGGSYHVYVHSDGYPSGAAEKFADALNSNIIWELPRFEADEFAAGFVAVNKDYAGSVRLTHGPESHGDLEYHYIVTMGRLNELQIDAAEMNGFGEQSRGEPFFTGSLADFIKQYLKVHAST